jgi:hypothetical protein
MTTPQHSTRFIPGGSAIARDNSEPCLQIPCIRLKHRSANARSTAGSVRDGTSGGRERRAYSGGGVAAQHDVGVAVLPCSRCGSMHRSACRGRDCRDSARILQATYAAICVVHKPLILQQRLFRRRQLSLRQLPTVETVSPARASRLKPLETKGFLSLAVDLHSPD